MRISERLQLGRLATPLPDRERPIYRWFQLKESFSSGLVRLLSETWGLGDGDLVLDPFCGSGTTLLACRELGLDCKGFDVHPLFLLASRVKIRDYDVEGLKAEVAEILGSEFKEEVPAPSFVARFFPQRVLSELVFFRERVLEVKDEKTREFLMLGLLNAAMDSSLASKDGAAIKITKKPVPPLREAFERRLLGMCRDIEQAALKGSKVEIELCDARELDAGGATAVITSPPYLAKQEYLHAYRIENWIAGLESPQPDELVGGAGLEGISPEKYFDDMRAVIDRLHKTCSAGAKVCLVVSDGCFPDGPVEVCLRLSEMAEEAGFKAKQVVVVNKRQCTTPSRRKRGFTKEALLIWEK
ncbi:MAG: DNA methyltransferase [Candidatus Hadarchaeota archaeon]